MNNSSHGVSSAARMIGLVIAATIAGCGGGFDSVHLSSATIRKQLTEPQRAALEAANKSETFAKADLGLWMRGDAVADLIKSANTIPNSGRGMNAVVTEQHMKLADEAAYYVELENLPANRAFAAVNNIDAKWSNKGLDLATDLAVRVDAVMHAHLKTLNVGVHPGFSIAAQSRVVGTIEFSRNEDPTVLLDATMKLAPTKIELRAETHLKDEKTICWRLEAPCGLDGWTVKMCEVGRDCKTAWSYDVPVGFGVTVPIDAVERKLPVKLNIPNTVRLVNTKGVLVDKTLALKVTSTGLDVDARGIALRVGVELAEAPAKPGAN